MSKEKLGLYPETGVIPTFAFYAVLYLAVMWQRTRPITAAMPGPSWRCFSAITTNLLHLALTDYTDEQEYRAVVAFFGTV